MNRESNLARSPRPSPPKRGRGRILGQSLLLITAACLVIQLAGCGASAPPREYASVSGVVKYNGKAVAKGTIFFRLDSGEGASGAIASDGKYTVKAIVGANKVQIISRDADPWVPKAPTPGSGPTASTPPKNYMPPRSLVPDVYSGPGTPLTAEIKSGTNTKDFDLQDIELKK